MERLPLPRREGGVSAVFKANRTLSPALTGHDPLLPFARPGSGRRNVADVWRSTILFAVLWVAACSSLPRVASI
jgi:hypothetical protein